MIDFAAKFGKNKSTGLGAVDSKGFIKTVKHENVILQRGSDNLFLMMMEGAPKKTDANEKKLMKLGMQWISTLERGAYGAAKEVREAEFGSRIRTVVLVSKYHDKLFSALHKWLKDKGPMPTKKSIGDLDLTPKYYEGKPLDGRPFKDGMINGAQAATLLFIHRIKGKDFFDKFRFGLTESGGLKVLWDKPNTQSIRTDVASIVINQQGEIVWEKDYEFIKLPRNWRTLGKRYIDNFKLESPEDLNKRFHLLVLAGVLEGIKLQGGNGKFKTLKWPEFPVFDEGEGPLQKYTLSNESVGIDVRGNGWASHGFYKGYAVRFKKEFIPKSELEKESKPYNHQWYGTSWVYNVPKQLPKSVEEKLTKLGYTKNYSFLDNWGILDDISANHWGAIRYYAPHPTEARNMGHEIFAEHFGVYPSGRKYDKNAPKVDPPNVFTVPRNSTKEGAQKKAKPSSKKTETTLDIIQRLAAKPSATKKAPVMDEVKNPKYDTLPSITGEQATSILALKRMVDDRFFNKVLVYSKVNGDLFVHYYKYELTHYSTKKSRNIGLMISPTGEVSKKEDFDLDRKKYALPKNWTEIATKFISSFKVENPDEDIKKRHLLLIGANVLECRSSMVVGDKDKWQPSSNIEGVLHPDSCTLVELMNYQVFGKGYGTVIGLKNFVLRFQKKHVPSKELDDKNETHSKLIPKDRIIYLRHFVDKKAIDYLTSLGYEEGYSPSLFANAERQNFQHWGIRPFVNYNNHFLPSTAQKAHSFLENHFGKTSVSSAPKKRSTPTEQPETTLDIIQRLAAKPSASKKASQKTPSKQLPFAAKKTASTPRTQKPKSIKKTMAPTITSSNGKKKTLAEKLKVTLQRNSEKEGMELKFSSEPGPKIKQALSKFGFRYHGGKQLWYRRFDDEVFGLVAKMFENESWSFICHGETQPVKEEKPCGCQKKTTTTRKKRTTTKKTNDAKPATRKRAKATEVEEEMVCVKWETKKKSSAGRKKTGTSTTGLSGTGGLVVQKLNEAKEVRAEGASVELKSSPFGRFLGRLGKDAVILVKGKKGQAKTPFVIRAMKDLVEIGPTLFVSGEMIPGTFLFEKYIDRHLDKETQEKIDNVGKPENGIHDLLPVAKKYDFIVVDSAQAVGLKPEDIETLRHAQTGTLWIIVSQETLAGNARGGTGPEYNSDYVIKLENRVAEWDKNRSVDVSEKDLPRLDVDKRKLLPSLSEIRKDIEGVAKKAKAAIKRKKKAA